MKVYRFLAVGSRVLIDADIQGVVDRVMLGPDALRYGIRWWSNGDLKYETFDECELTPCPGALWARIEAAGMVE